MDKQTITLTLGDSSGIGPELVVKALNDMDLRDSANWIIVGDEEIFNKGMKIAGKTLTYNRISNIEEFDPQAGNLWFIDLNNMNASDYNIGELSAASGKQSGEALKYAMNIALDNYADAVVYGPLNKDALHKGGFNFHDDLHFFADLLNCKEGFGEVNVMDDLWVTRVTSHIPLREVRENISEERVRKTIEFAHGILTQANIENPKLAVSALNPHAGDNGLLGDEEYDIIKPAIEKVQNKGINVAGPYPSDTILNERKKLDFDCMIAMYHDQAQIGMKLLGFNRGVTISGGLPVILTTPAHGTAFDIAGKNKADEGAMIHAMRKAQDLISKEVTQK
ncbi:4-hydroxythreonine-4-phosphate dehydrogenase [Geomicrobium halophilum]|uniref:4-hydroxythreonine-4-phosphate dehydrogenase n=1 Tax=Geomicrobium halophilum TaxID=549000 RepID=A0A841PX55_9BACL|nr:4-hydroxythreonine-4-phosphate dehydrogenase PdxA [Geomicrobium halophilum]MBB6448662.1 4-hydroxythreonine-4-phosphate dehydrogenase [Geomicrobium halophilum]